MIAYSQSHDSIEFTLMLMVVEPLPCNGLYEDLLAFITDAPQFKFLMPMKATIVEQ